MQIRWIASLAALALVATLTVDATAGPTGSPPPARDAAPPGSSVRITLITGDRVRVVSRPGSPDQVMFEPGPGSSSTSAVITRGGGHTTVIPAEVADEVAAGRLDRSLFDVTTLIADRYDDARSPVLPVIIEYAGSPATARSHARTDTVRGARSSRALNSIGSRAVAVQKSAGSAFWRSSVGTSRRVDHVGKVLEPAIKRIWLDRRTRTTLDESVPQIGAPAAWQRGLTGQGVKIAVLDTGIDTGHPDLANRVAESANFSDSPDTADRVGHGTHVASIIGGTGAASDGKYRGVAPDSTLLNGKVLGDDGFGTFSAIIAGMEWAARRADIVNLSLGSQDPSDGTDPLSRALDTLSEQTGALFVVAAGNCPPIGQRAQISSPAAADEALAVSNLLRDGSLSEWSCRGPRRADFAIKPQIGAPGTGIVAARAAGTDIGDPVDEHYTALSGTSMATPHVAGTAGLLAQAHPDWKGAQLRSRLVSTADPAAGDEVDATGSGRVDADQATDGTVSTDNAELEFGYVRWPHPNPAPVTRTVTYRNTGSSPVTLDLAAALDPGDQGPAPRLSTGQVVVPAGGQATVQVTADMAAAGLGPRAGRVLATPATGGDPLVTTFGWYLEPERYDLTIKGVFRDGSPAFADLAIGRPDGGEAPDTGIFGLPMVDGVAKIRVEPGVYDVSSTFIEFATDEHIDQFTVVAAPQFTVSADTTVTLDARTGRPVTTNVSGQSGLNARQRSMGYRRMAAGEFQASGTAVHTTGVPREFFATPTGTTSIGRLEFSTGIRLELPPYTAQVLGPDAPPLPVTDFYFGPRFTGRKDLVAVNAGSGSPEDLAGDRVRGKLAVITCTHDEVAGDKALAAEQAGAAAVLFYNPDWPGPNGIFPFFFPEDAQIPAMRTSRAAAGDLLKRVASGMTTVRITGVAETPKVYDLVRAWPGRVPGSASYTAEPRQFATVHETFGAQGNGTPTSEVRHGFTPLGSSHGSWLVPTFRAPRTRTSYVLGGGSVQWSQTVVVDNGGANAIFGAAPRTHRAGEQTSQRWLTPVAASGLPDSTYTYMGVHQVGSFFGVLLSAFAAGPLQYEDPLVGNVGTFQLSVERNGQLLGTSEQPMGFFEAEPAAADYRISLDAQRELSWWRHSARVRSVWTFRSAGNEQETMPLVLADLTVPTADARSRVATGRPTPVLLTLRHQAGSLGSPFSPPKLEMSYDDSTWTALHLRPVGGDRFVALINHPASRAGQSVSFRLDAKDANSGRLQQEITSAYGLK